MPFDFRHLNSGADFEIEYYQNGLVVYRRTALPAAQRLMSDLCESLLLAGLDVNLGAARDFLRVEKGAINMNVLAEDIADQLQAQDLAGDSQRFVVINRYKEPEA